MSRLGHAALSMLARTRPSRFPEEEPMRHRPRPGVAALAVLCLLVGGPSAGVIAQTGEYKIGVLEPLTGPLAFEGKRHLEGYEIMRDLVNAHGGVMGRKLAFAVGDAVDPTAAASEANRLITREGVRILTGTYSST